MKKIAVMLLCLSLPFISAGQAKGLKKKAMLSNPPSFTLLGEYNPGSGPSRQGAAVHGDYLLQAVHMGKCDIYDIPTQAKLKTIQLLPDIGEQNHANNICFSDTFFDKGDMFPLLYLSENRAPRIAVNRIASLDSPPELVQHITLPERIGHYINAVIDTRKGFIYTVCYKLKNWRTEEPGNCLLVSKLRLPLISEGDVSVEIIEQFEIPFMVATQGAFFCDGLIVHGFGINTDENDGIVMIDPVKKAVVRRIDTHDIFRDEIEGLAPYRGNVLVTLQYGKVYLVDFNRR